MTKQDNVMRTISVEKVTLNVGAGKEQGILDKGVKLLKHITSIDPVKTITQKRIPSWGLRPGLAVGCKITLRKEAAKKILIQLLTAKDNELTEKNFDKEGNLAFGIPEYIDIEGIKYAPEIGMMGFEVSVTVTRPGFRIKKRRTKSKVGSKHKITKQESIEFFKKEFNIKIGEE